MTDRVDKGSQTAIVRFKAFFTKHIKNIDTGFVINIFNYGFNHQADLLNLMINETNGLSDKDEISSSRSVLVELRTQQCSIPFNSTKVYNKTVDLFFRWL